MTTLANIQEEVQPQVRPEPTALERCDRCGAQAYIVAAKDGKDRLLFCAHHGRKHAPVLLATGHEILDYTYLINDKPTSPSVDDI